MIEQLLLSPLFFLNNNLWNEQQIKKLYIQLYKTEFEQVEKVAYWDIFATVSLDNLGKNYVNTTKNSDESVFLSLWLCLAEGE